jgi:hypothetical protein
MHAHAANDYALDSLTGCLHYVAPCATTATLHRKLASTRGFPDSRNDAHSSSPAGLYNGATAKA